MVILTSKIRNAQVTKSLLAGTVPYYLTMSPLPSYPCRSATNNRTIPTTMGLLYLGRNSITNNNTEINIQSHVKREFM
ncbi:hypothetical protein P5V15_009917 [Pogonomyrmex californicus]